MKCDHCDNEATVHETTRVNGVRIERHLCESCAAKQGLGATPNATVQELLKHAVQLGAGVAPARAQACPTCRLSFAEFKQHGLLGCADCYQAFEGALAPLLERAHQGSSRHTGKVPRRASGGSGPRAEVDARAARIRRIRDELEAAVRAEQYERAARLRDEMHKLGGGEGA